MAFYFNGCLSRTIKLHATTYGKFEFSSDKILFGRTRGTNIISKGGGDNFLQNRKDKSETVFAVNT